MAEDREQAFYAPPKTYIHTHAPSIPKQKELEYHRNYFPCSNEKTWREKKTKREENNNKKSKRQKLHKTKIQTARLRSIYSNCLGYVVRTTRPGCVNLQLLFVFILFLNRYKYNCICISLSIYTSTYTHTRAYTEFYGKHEFSIIIHWQRF